jgi:hypothetical protein
MDYMIPPSNSPSQPIHTFNAKSRFSRGGGCSTSFPP